MLTDRLDLRSGDTPWDDDIWRWPAADPLPATRRDIAIVGAGITGAILAERLSGEGHSVVLLDRRPPGSGSTAASTAQIMWAMDVPLMRLSAQIGEEQAARRWRRVHAAVRDFAARLDALDMAAHKRRCPTVYLAGGVLDAQGLAEECGFHQRHALPSRYLAAAEVHERFGLKARAAIVSGHGFTIDPVETAHGLLEQARSQGAAICHPCDVTAIRETDGGVVLALADGNRIEVGQVVLATGYERAALFLPAQFRLLSTFVMATPPGTAPLWQEQAMIWEASDPYLYFRTDPSGRVIVGGEDEDIEDAGRRDALMRAKAGTIAARAGAVLGTDPLVIDKVWAATFGSSPDGLPAIGRAANTRRVWLSAGFGGNGIAFSALAGDLLARGLAGDADADAECFDPYRFAR